MSRKETEFDRYKGKQKRDKNIEKEKNLKQGTDDKSVKKLKKHPITKDWAVVYDEESDDEHFE